MTVTLEPALDPEAWNALLASDPNASFFHTPPWSGAWLDAYPYYRPAWLVARNGGGDPVGALPALESVRCGLVQRFSLPYGAYGTPLVRGDDRRERDAVRRRLLDAWWREASRARVVRAHLTLFVPPGGEPMPSWLGAERTRAETTHLLDLSVGFEHLWSQTIGGNVRTSCRKAERLGVRVVRESGGIEEIARLYREQVGDWRNHTPFPPALFRSLAQRGGDSVEGWVARREGEVVAGKLMLLHGDQAHSWVAVNRSEAKRLRASPLLHCRIMEDLCGRGIRWYNFGSSRGAPGVESFKEGLGGTGYPYATCLREAGWFRPLHRLQYRARGIRGGV